MVCPAPNQEQNSLVPCPLRASSLPRGTDIKPTATYRSAGVNCGKKEDLAGPRGSRESRKGARLCSGLVKPVGKEWSLAWDVKMDEELASWGKEESVDQAGAPPREGPRHPVEPGSRAGWVSVVSSAFSEAHSALLKHNALASCAGPASFQGRKLFPWTKKGAIHFSTSVTNSFFSFEKRIFASQSTVHFRFYQEFEKQDQSY